MITVITRRVVGSQVAAAALLASAVAGCASQASQAKNTEFCAQLEQFRASVAQVRQVDPETVTVEQARGALETVQAELLQLMAAADLPIGQYISNVRAALTALREAVNTAGASALTTARPLVADARDDVREAVGTLQQNVSGGCPS